MNVASLNPRPQSAAEQATRRLRKHRRRKILPQLFGRICRKNYELDDVRDGGDAAGRLRPLQVRLRTREVLEVLQQDGPEQLWTIEK